MIARTHGRRRVGVRVENFGAATFQSSLELVKFMRSRRACLAERLPGMVVFYDGYNGDNHGYYFGAGNMQNDLSAKLATLVEHEQLFTLSLYGVNIGPRPPTPRSGKLMSTSAGAPLFRDPDPQPDEANLHRAVDIYLRNMRSRAGSARRSARCLFVRQPLVATKTTPGRARPR